MREYHLHKDDYSKLQLDINAASAYCSRNAQHCFIPHRHSFYQIIWFKNKGTHYVDYMEHEHPDNSIYFLSKGQVHNFCNHSNNNGFLFHFNDLFFNKQEQDISNQIEYRLFNEIGKPFVQIPKNELTNFDYLTNQLTQEIKQQKFNYKQQLFYYFQILLLNIERLKRTENKHIETDHHFELASLFKKSVYEHRHEFKSVSFFSQLIGVSDKTLNTVSKKYLNHTPANFIHQQRIIEAKRLLSNTNLSKKEIAYELGFEQATYFSKYFKKHTTLTPKDFQNQML